MATVHVNSTLNAPANAAADRHHHKLPHSHLLPHSYHLLGGHSTGTGGHSTSAVLTAPPGCAHHASVVYVSFGSAAAFSAPQMTEMAHALRQTSSNFLWVVKATKESYLPNKFVEETSGEGLVAAWCLQLEVLAHQAIGCFITHCGWNSTVEGVSLGVAMVGIPQFLVHMTNAYLLEKLWEVGVQPKVDEKGLASREEIERCINQVMQAGERGQEFKKKAMQWKQFAKEAVNEGGSSDKCIDEIIFQLVCT